MSKRVKLNYCQPITEAAEAAGAHAAAASAAAARHILPASFPAHLLDDDQLTAAEDWWQNYLHETIERIRAALTVPYGGQTEGGQSLEHLYATALVLCHLLNLHPAAHHNMTTLAKVSHRAKKTLIAVRDAMLPILRGATPPPPRRLRTPSTAASLAALMKSYPQLKWTARSASGNITIVPFAAHLTLTEQWDTVLSLAATPGITATLDIDAHQRDAVRITLN